MRVIHWLFGVVPIAELEAQQKERLELLRRNINLGTQNAVAACELSNSRTVAANYFSDLLTREKQLWDARLALSTANANLEIERGKNRELAARHDEQLRKKCEALGALRGLGKINELTTTVARELQEENDELRQVATLREILLADLRQQLETQREELETQRQQLETLQDELGDVAVQERHPLAVRQAEDAIRWRRVMTILDSKNDYAQELREALAKAGIPTNG